MSLFDKDDVDIDIIEDDEQNAFENQYLIIYLADEMYGLPVSTIKEIVMKPEVIRVPGTERAYSGVIKLRNETFPLIDLRKLLGLKSIREEDQELIRLLKEREKEHVNWVNELLLSVRERRDFTLTTDPHACAFGKWYDNFKSDDINLSLYLSQFDIPHQRIHRVAHEVEDAVKAENFDLAEEIIDNTKNKELKLMIELFKNVDKEIKASHRELAIVTFIEDDAIAVTADKVHEIVTIMDDKIDLANSSSKNSYIKGVGRSDEYSVVILDIKKLFNLKDI